MQRLLVNPQMIQQLAKGAVIRCLHLLQSKY